MKKLFVLLVVILLAAYWVCGGNFEQFYNILPTEIIDTEYLNLNQGRAYFDAASGQSYQVVGKGGVDLNCNAVETRAILHWIRWNDPAVLNHYVFRFDPSANIDNPDDAPRILKMLLRNLPSQHKYVPILSNCFPTTVRV